MVKTRYTAKTKQKRQVTIRKQLDPNRVFVKLNSHPALALIDLQTIGGDLIRAQFVYLYKLPVVIIEPKTSATTIKGSEGNIGQTCEVELSWAGSEETRMCYVAHLSGWDIILGTAALRDVRATISPVTTPLTLQPTSMDRFSLRMWQGNRLTDQKSDLSTAASSILALADELAVRAVELENRFNPIEEFAALIPKEIPRQFPPRRKIYHKIDINT